MATDAQPVMDLSGVEIYTLFVFTIVRIAFFLVTGGALLKLLRGCYVLDGVMTSRACNAGPRFVRKGLIGVYLRLVTLVVKQHEPSAAV